MGERVNGIHEVRGSIPLASTCGNSSVGRAQPCQGWGRGFESRFPLLRTGGARVSLPGRADTIAGG